MISLEKVSFAFGDRTVLRDISFRAGAGECLVVLGPNGSGKTTLIRLLAGVLFPLAGKVLLEGRPVSRLPARERARRISWIPQSPRAELDFTVLETVLMGRHPYHSLFGGDSLRDRESARQALAEMGVEALAEQPVTQCSGGELQRVMAARMLTQEAPIMLLDEPVSNLDIRNQADTLSAVRRRTDAGKTAVCVLHDLNLAAHYATRILLLCRGETVADGRPESVLEPGLLSRVYDIPIRKADDAQPLFVPDYGSAR